MFGFKSENEASSIAPRKPIRALLAFAASLSLPLTAPPLEAQGSVALEDPATAVFLSNFPSFGHWPANALPTGQVRFLVSIGGINSLVELLTEVPRTITAHERQIEICWIRKGKPPRSCQVPFVSQSEQKKRPWSLRAVRGLSVLTVRETPEFLGPGGVLSFSMQREKPGLDVNLNAAQRAHLKVCSRMLVLIQRAAAREETGKS